MNSEPVAEANYYDLARSELHALIPSPPGAVLDIGCGSGTLLRHLRSIGASYTAGIELVPGVAEAAQRLGNADAIHCLNVEADDMPYPANRFDCVVMSHVLEHMVDPWRTLSKVLTVLRPGGTFVGAIPNVRYFPVLRDLLMSGRFDYKASGVLDRTHLRFFTRASIASLLEDAGLKVERLEPEISGRKARLLARLSGGLLDDMACYAYNFKCIKPPALETAR